MTRIGVFIDCANAELAKAVRKEIWDAVGARSRVIRLRDKAKHSETDRMADVVLAMVRDYQAWKDGMKGDKPAEPEKCERCGGSGIWYRPPQYGICNMVSRDDDTCPDCGGTGRKL